MANFLDEYPTVTAPLDEVYGADLRLIMTNALHRLAGAFPDLGKDVRAKLRGPTMEGRGMVS